MAEDTGKSGDQLETARPRLVGICLRYCDVEGNQTDMWINMNKIRALAWTTDRIGSRPANPPYGNNVLDIVPPPAPCKPGAPMIPGEPLCWWDGSQWRCD